MRSGIVNARNASISGCGDPYQIESVPHTMRSGPSATSSLPSTCAASTGRRSMRNQVLPSSAYTLPPGADAVRRASARARAGRRRGSARRRGSYGALLAVGVALVARVVHDERRCRGTRRPPDRCRGGDAAATDAVGIGPPSPCAPRRPAVRARARARGTGSRSRRRRGTSRRSATPSSAGRTACSTSSPTAGARASSRPSRRARPGRGSDARSCA